MTHPFTVGGVPMQYPFMIGGGVCKFVHQLNPYLRPDLPVGALEVGSFTPALREGNPGSPQWPEDYGTLRRYGFGLNAWSMPNAGFQGSLNELAGLPSPHPIVVNVAGEKPADFVRGVLCSETLQNVAATTLNFGCPNTEKIPIAYSIPSMQAILDAIWSAKPKKPVWVKLSPYITKEERDKFAFLLQCQTGVTVDMSETPLAPEGFLEQALDVVNGYSFVRAVILTNTLGNVKFTDPKTGKNAIGCNNGKGGLSGDLLREKIVLPLVKRAVHFLESDPHTTDVIACGGIFSGEHVLDYLHAGAKGVQCVSGPIWNGGPRFFRDLLAESEELQHYLEQYL
jgi:dihydroorotate dehydrogenase